MKIVGCGFSTAPDLDPFGKSQGHKGKEKVF